MNHSPESYHPEEQNPEVSRISTLRETRDIAASTEKLGSIQQLTESRDLQNLTLHINPILIDAAHAAGETYNASKEEQHILHTTMESALKIKMNTTLYEIRNVSDHMLGQYFSDTLQDIFRQQERALDTEKNIFSSFKGSPDEAFANGFLWKCKQYLEEIHHLKKNMLEHIMKQPPKTTNKLIETYLYIYDMIWKHASLLASPKTWMREFEGGLAVNQQSEADTLLKNFPAG